MTISVRRKHGQEKLPGIVYVGRAPVHSGAGTMASDSGKLLAPGTILARRYRIAHCIKAGGMGAVYEVSDVKTKRRLALKTVRPGLSPSASLRARFEQEASITASIDSEHIVKVEDAGL